MLKAQFHRIKGQSLIEILIGIAVGVVIIGGVTGTIAITLRSTGQNKNIQTATSLGQELINKVTDLAAANWHNIDGLTAGNYYLTPAGGSFTVTAGIESGLTVPPEAKVFSRYFTISNASRDPATDSIESVYNAANIDPSTRKIVVTVTWQENQDTANTSLNKYVTRSKNLIFHQTDWSGATGQAGPLTVPNTRYDSKSNINTTGVPGSMKVQGF